MSDFEIQNLTLDALRATYQSGATTPAQLIKTLRAQAESQQDYNAWITLLSEEQLDGYLKYLDGKSLEDLPLYGVPFAIKDNIDLAGVETTAACPDFAYIPEQSAFVVDLLLRAGAIPLGKTNLDQFATGLVGVRSPYGEGKNVFNRDYLSGGSSAGSAIATALGQVSFALGTDTAGSGRVPAAFNNLIGHKPTKGLISNTGVVPACKSLDCVSIFSLQANDAAYLLDIMAQYDEADCFARPNRYDNIARYFNGQVAADFKFGVPKQLDFQGDPETQSLYQQAISELTELGGEAVELDFEPFLNAAKLLYEGPWVAERWWATQMVEPESMLDVIATIIKGAEGATAAQAFDAQYQLQALKKQCDALLANVDFVVTPTTPTVYTRMQLQDQPIQLNSVLGTYTNFMNLLDYSATAVPMGWLSSGVAWGVTLFADAFKDILLLNYSAALQQSLAQQQSLTLGATGHPFKLSETLAPAVSDAIQVAVCGAHLAGQPLNWQLTERGASLVAKTHSAPCYQLFALPDGKRPAMVRNEQQGDAIEVEVWQLPKTAFGSFVAGIPAPLGIGKVELADGSFVPGFICEHDGIAGAKDVSEFKGWRGWLANR